MLKFISVKITLFLLSFGFLLAFSSCSGDKPNTSDITIDVEFKNFTEDLFAIKGEINHKDIQELEDKYGSFLSDYTYYIMGYGAPYSDTTIRALNFFKADPQIKYLHKLVTEKYGDFGDQKESIINAYKNYAYYFPEDKDSLNDVVSFISIFTMNLNPIGDDYTGISMEMYMGDTFSAYKVIKPEIPHFLHKLFTPNQITVQNMKAILYEKLAAVGGHKGRVLDEMLLWGKLFYLSEKIVLDAENHEIIGYDEGELDWANDNESEIWKFFIKDKKMFDNMNAATQKLFAEGPRTNYQGVPIDYCVPMLGKYTGWKIIQSYMKNNEVSLKELVNNQNADEILKLSSYKP